jgi:methionyl-tRNA synthetase
MTEGIVSFDEWSKLDLRVGQIVKVEEIENADKLYKLTIDLGDFGKRIVCAGLKQHYGKTDLLDKRIILFVNLNPRKMKGIESRGMILAAVNEKEDKVVFITPEDEIELGSKVR